MISNYNDLQSIFSNDLTVRTIAEVYSTCPEEELETFSETSGFDTILYSDSEGKYMVFDNWKTPRKNILEHADVISDSTPLIEAFELIVKFNRMFIKSGKKIDRIATLSDLNKIPFRIWMFGVISILELALRQLIENTISEGWSSFLSVDRLDSANKLYSFKKKKNVDINLIECILLKDLCSIIFKSNTISSLLKIEMSKTKFEETFDTLNQIRDELAHSNKTFTNNWLIIYESIKFAEDLINKCDKVMVSSYSREVL